jgi:hypothetical protein
MCPPISCCHQRLTQPLPTQVYYLARLLLAFASAELPADDRQAAEIRFASLWDQVQRAVQHRAHGSAADALALTECLTAQLLRAACCRQSLRDAVPLAEALVTGPAGPAIYG